MGPFVSAIGLGFFWLPGVLPSLLKLGHFWIVASCRLSSMGAIIREKCPECRFWLRAVAQRATFRGEGTLGCISLSTGPGFSLCLSWRDVSHVVSSSLPCSERRPLDGNIMHLGPWGVSADGGLCLVRSPSSCSSSSPEECRPAPDARTGSCFVSLARAARVCPGPRKFSGCKTFMLTRGHLQASCDSWSLYRAPPPRSANPLGV